MGLTGFRKLASAAGKKLYPRSKDVRGAILAAKSAIGSGKPLGPGYGKATAKEVKHFIRNRRARLQRGKS